MISRQFSSHCSNVAPWVVSMGMTRSVLSFLRNAARDARAGDEGTTAARVATYPVVVRGFAWTLLVTGIAGCTIVAIHNTLRVSVLVDVPILAVLCAMVTESTRVRVEWTDAVISFASPWSARRSVRWDEIVAVTYSQSARWYVMRGRGGVTIRLSELLGGLGALFEDMKRRGSDEIQAQVARVTAMRSHGAISRQGFGGEAGVR